MINMQKLLVFYGDILDRLGRLDLCKMPVQGGTGEGPAGDRYGQTKDVHPESLAGMSLLYLAIGPIL